MGHGWAWQGIGLVGQFQGRSMIGPMALCIYKKTYFNSNFFYHLQTYSNSNQIQALNDFYSQIKIREHFITQ
jgi:hypothetical protein